MEQLRQAITLEAHLSEAEFQALCDEATRRRQPFTQFLSTMLQHQAAGFAPIPVAEKSDSSKASK
jgi:hypothetical protein